MHVASKPDIVCFGRDMTLRWPCRGGDFVLWMGFPSIFSGPESLQIRDFWEMRAGYHVTITNRPEDLPTWFTLHPTETCDSLAFKMMEKLEKGYKPGDRIDGPNLWRLKAGERVAWVGTERPERGSVNGILAILDIEQCALAVGEGNFGSAEEFIGFGAPTAPHKPEDVARCHAAVEIVRQLGTPRTWAPEWRLG